MKGVLISIQKPHTDNIRALIKKVEVRKTVPKLKRPFPVFIYETKAKGGCGKVIGEFVCRGVMYGGSHLLPKQSCLTLEEIWEYAKGKRVYGWRIADLKIYDKPKELSEFKAFCKNYYDGKGCDDCKYFIDGRSYEYDESDCGCSGRKPLERPPQSWCYVEVQE